MLIAAISGRALAQSARQSGYVPLVADFFGDLDTREAAGEVVKVEGAFADGFKRQPLMKALTQLAVNRNPIGVVSGAGFEQPGDLLNEIATHWPVFGNDPKTIVKLKDPIQFAELCKTLAIPHPETCLDPPHAGQWLVKQKGGSGGSHIKLYSPLLPSGVAHIGEAGWEKVPDRADEGSSSQGMPASVVYAAPSQEPSSGLRPPSPIHLRPCGLRRTGEGETRCYFQRKVSGASISALFLADGREFRIVGFSRQWVSPTLDEPFRYGGAVQPIEFGSHHSLLPSSRRKPGPIVQQGKSFQTISQADEWVPAFAGMTEDKKAQLIQSIALVVSTVPLRGLNSADFIVSDDEHWLLEINPRPGATLDIFPGELFKAHIDACEGRLPSQPFTFKTAQAAAIVYAERDIASVAAVDWPDWAIDRQAPGTSVAAGEPLCTVKAEASSADTAVKLLKQREVSIRQQLEGCAV